MDGYKLANLDEFDKLQVPQAYYTETLEGLGQVEYGVIKCLDMYGLIFNNEIMFVGLNDENPTATKKTAAYVDADRNLWGGVL